MDVEVERARWNGCRWDPDRGAGHYESWYQRANHPQRPLAFWIRYTLFVPAGAPDRARGQLWAIVFDGEHDRVVAVQEDVPVGGCGFDRGALDVTVGASRLDATSLRGQAFRHRERVAWDLRYTSPEPPLLLYPEARYESAFPPQKSLVGSPNAVFTGRVEAAGLEPLEVEGWVGSQAHNWGSRHTDRYAFAQVAGFDGAPGWFLECGSGQMKLGPLRVPPVTLLVLRRGDESFAIRRIRDGLRVKSQWSIGEGELSWTVAAHAADFQLRASLRTPRTHVVELAYPNPPGGHKTCFNTKIATCDLTLDRPGHPTLELRSKHRALLEMLR